MDIKGIGFYALGSHRKNLSNDQKKEYSKLFEKADLTVRNIISNIRGFTPSTLLNILK